MAKIGVVMVPLNVNLRGEGLEYIINHSDAKVLILNDAQYEAYSLVEKNLNNIEKRIWHSENTATPVNFTSLKSLIEAAEDKAPPLIKIDDRDPLGIIYTSGTTGRPKGAMIPHFNYINTASVWVNEILQYCADDIMYTCLPLFHANAQMYTTMGALCSGRPFVLRERFSASLFWDDIRSCKATIFNYIGSILTILIKQPERKNDAENPIRIAFGGTAPLEIWHAFEKRFGLTIIEGYGATETGALPICSPPDKIKVGSIGIPISFVHVTIWDENKREVPIGQSGEIVVKEKVPNTMFLKYYKQKDKTEEAWEGGWFHTGDRAYKDEDGYYYFLDRMKDCIRRRGENISSYDIESIVDSHPKVLESAAVAVPSELGEDEIKIYLVLQPNEQLTPQEIVKYCEERMAAFMVPRYVEFLGEFPKTATERTMKYELKKRGIGNSWDREK